MAKGRDILLTVEPRGFFGEGIAGEIITPGTVLAIKAATAPVGGRHTLNADTTGAIGVALPDYLQGKLVTDTIPVGGRVQYYVPQAGDEFNALFVASDGAQAIGDEVGPVGAAGQFATAGTGYIVMEALTVGASPAAGTLVWVKKKL